jgi:hypothetical protein
MEVLVLSAGVGQDVETDGLRRNHGVTSRGRSVTRITLARGARADKGVVRHRAAPVVDPIRDPARFVVVVRFAILPYRIEPGTPHD